MISKVAVFKSESSDIYLYVGEGEASDSETLEDLKSQWWTEESLYLETSNIEGPLLQSILEEICE